MSARTTSYMSSRDDATVPRRSLACLTAVLVLATAAPATAQADPLSSDRFAPLRSDMVENLRRSGIKEPSVLTAMRSVPRHLFVLESRQPQAYEDSPVEIAPGHSLPQASLSAQMIELLELDGDEKVLEIGTGSGYDAAILSQVAKEVYTIEIDRDLGRQARETLRELGYDNVWVRIGDGHRGWPEEAPFDAIMVTAAPESVPPALLKQLKVGGKMVLAVGSDFVQDLKVITKTADGKETRRISPVVLVPMIEPPSE